jgi:hypothetical protein
MTPRPRRLSAEAYARQLASERARYERWRSHGLCGKCGVEVSRFATCLQHRQANAAGQRRRYQKGQSDA